MYSRRNLGLIAVVIGILLTCCLCPLALNNLLLVATSGGSPSNIISLYGSLFSTRVGTITASSYVILGQLACATLLGLFLLVVGALAVAGARDNTGT